MAWYYYSGNTPVPVPVKKGASVSVVRGSKTEILIDSPQLQALLRNGMLKRTSAPVGRMKAEDIKISDKKVKDVVKEPEFSKRFVEIKQEVVDENQLEADAEVPIKEEVTQKEEDLNKDENDEEKEIEKSEVLLEDGIGRLGKRGRRRSSNTE